MRVQHKNAASGARRSFWILFAAMNAVSVPAASGQPFGVAHGTSVVVLRSPDLLWAAVDSKIIYVEYPGDGSRKVTETTACKIQKVGDYYAVLANLVSGTNGFDLRKSLAELGRPGEPLAQLVRRTADTIPPLLVPVLRSLKNADPEVYAQQYDNAAATEIAFLGIVKNRPEATIIQFIATQNDGVVSVRAGILPHQDRRKAYGYAMGAIDRIAEALKAYPPPFQHPSQAEAERLIRLEYADRPDVVGGPINFIEATRFLTTEVRSGACQTAGGAGPP